jgi:hypothetical protein
MFVAGGKGGRALAGGGITRGRAVGDGTPGVTEIAGAFGSGATIEGTDATGFCCGAG